MSAVFVPVVRPASTAAAASTITGNALCLLPCLYVLVQLVQVAGILEVGLLPLGLKADAVLKQLLQLVVTLLALCEYGQGEHQRRKIGNVIC